MPLAPSAHACMIVGPLYYNVLGTINLFRSSTINFSNEIALTRGGSVALALAKYTRDFSDYYFEYNIGTV